MKKQFLFIVASIFTMLFAACSQENELDTPDGKKSNLVSVSTQLPTDFAKTRASVEGHQLRCILEVWTKENPITLISRHEKLAATTDENISFIFEVAEGKYNCLMWADFVTNTTVAEKSKSGITYQGYEDNLYKTSSMTAIEVVDVNDLFNTEACDAFFGMQPLVKEATAATLSTSLTRPFAKLTIKEKEENSYKNCTNVKVGYKVPNKFSVKSGAVVANSEVEATYTGEVAGNNVYFTHYILASKNGETLNNIAMTFTVGGKEIEKTIPSGVPTKRNYRTNARGNFIPETLEAGEAKVDISFGNDWLDNGEDQEVTPGKPEITPVVGDFYYADGTYTATYAEDASNPCIGIVFAVGAKGDDAVANYGPKLSAIKGYVLAVKDAAEQAAWGKEVVKATIEGTSYSDKDYLGYKNSVAIKGTLEEASYKEKYLAAYACSSFTELKAPNATSGWYLPSIGQLGDIAALYYDSTLATDKILKTKLAKLETAGQLLRNNGADGNYWSSTVATNFKLYRMQFFPGNSDTPYGKKGGTGATTKETYTRCVLTF